MYTSVPSQLHADSRRDVITSRACTQRERERERERDRREGKVRKAAATPKDLLRVVVVASLQLGP